MTTEMQPHTEVPQIATESPAAANGLLADDNGIGTIQSAPVDQDQGAPRVAAIPAQSPSLDATRCTMTRVIVDR